MKRVVVLVIALGLNGCGGSGNESNDSLPATTSQASTPGPGDAAPRLSQKEFVAKATRICRDNANAITKFNKRELQKPEIARMTALEQRLHLFQVHEKRTLKAMDKIGRLRAPLAVEKDVQTMVSDVKEMIALIGQASTATEDESSEIATRAVELAGTSRRAAQNAGLQGCLPEQTP